MKIGIMTSSTREGRQSINVANWALELANARGDKDVQYEIIDIKDYNLPIFDFALSAEDQTNVDNFKNKVAEQDGFIFIVSEYNHGLTGVFKNALDFLKPEFADKSVGYVGYGGVGGARAIEQLRMINGEQGLASVQKNVNLFLSVDFVNFQDFKPGDFQVPLYNQTVDQVLLWAKALKTIR